MGVGEHSLSTDCCVISRCRGSLAYRQDKVLYLDPGHQVLVECPGVGGRRCCGSTRGELVIKVRFPS